MKFKWDPNAPAGDKVFDVQIMKDGSYKPLVLTETYRMATNSFVAKGGDGYKSFADAIAEGNTTRIWVTRIMKFSWNM